MRIFSSPVCPTVASGKKVVDLSADFRLRDPELYKKWYMEHKSTELLEEAVYGLPEINRTSIKGARLVANPGCYPTSAVLTLAPALGKGLIDPSSIIIDSKSGVSGAGRGAALETSFVEVASGSRSRWPRVPGPTRSDATGTPLR
jgi:N-acetyl-gamma-glutamyl-phosphate reductase